MKRKFSTTLLTAAVVAALTSTAGAAPFTPGNLAIFRFGVEGDGSSPTVAADAVFVDEYTPAGVRVQSIPMPTTTVGAQRRFATQGNANIEGLLNRSTDGKYVWLTGYDAAPGDNATGTTLAQSDAASINRVIARVDASGAVDTSTVFNDGGVGSPRAVISDSGTNVWFSTNGGGARYTTFGTSGASTPLTSTNQGDVRHLDIFGGQLYGSSSSSTTGVFSIGTGLPTSGDGQTIGALTGVATGAGTNTGTGGTGAGTIQFFFADLDAGVVGQDTLYVVGDGNGAAMRKYSLVGGTWADNGIIGDSDDADSANDENYRGLTGSVSGNTVTLYAIRHGVSNTLDQLVKVTDSTGYNATWTNPSGGPTLLASAGANTKFQGIDFVPVNAALPGDFNGDQKVNTADYNVWQTNYGTTMDGEDFLIWQANYNSAQEAAVIAAAVPEPGTAALALVGVIGVGLRRRGRRA